MRQIVLDTETTGLTPTEHRIIEIGCIELMDRQITDRHYHQYINPERAVDEQALAIHGLSNEFLVDQPTFAQVVEQFLLFVQDAPLIIHNAPFDLAFFQHELHRTQLVVTDLAKDRQIIDTLLLARQRYPGQRNNLDALCKRFGVDNTKRHLHGALLDAVLLAQVYLKMTGGQENFFDVLDVLGQQDGQDTAWSLPEGYTQLLTVLSATEHELVAHEAYLDKMRQQGSCLWLQDEVVH